MGRVALLRANTEHAVALRVLDFTAEALGVAKDQGVRLTEQEGALFLALWTGHSMEAVREKFRKILRLIPGVYPASRLCGYLVRGLDSKIRRPGSRCWRSSRA